MGWASHPLKRNKERKERGREMEMERKRTRSDVLYLCAILMKLAETGGRMCTVMGTRCVSGSGRGTHILRQTGMCRSHGSLFYKKSLNMGPVFFYKKP